MDSEATDEELATRARAGEGAAATELVQRLGEWLQRHVRGYFARRVRTRDSSSDVVQETWIAALSGTSRFDERGAGSFRAWLKGIAAHKAAIAQRRGLTQRRDLRRERSLDAGSEHDTPRSAAATPSVVALHRETLAKVAEATRTLSADDQQVLHVTGAESSVAAAELARLLGVSVSAAEKRRTRAEQRRREAVEAGGAPARAGPCRLLALRGRGSMGLVYRAELTRETKGRPAGTPVAVKLLQPRLTGVPEFEARFRREARIGTRIVSPRIARTLGAGFTVVGGVRVPYLMSEYLEGDDLRECLRQRRRLDEPLLRVVAEDVATALQSMHAAGVIHRDLKPENLILGPDGRVCVTDLGLARLMDCTDALTRSGCFVGTLRYSAPELYGSPASAPDARSDLYGLGLTLYELAVGRAPYDHADLRTLLKRRLEGPPLHPRATRRGLSRGLDGLIAHLLEPQRAERTASAEEVLAAVRDLQD